jgi:hypothetical protein
MPAGVAWLITNLREADSRGGFQITGRCGSRLLRVISGRWITVFAVVMIVCNGLVGLCLLSGGVGHHEQGFQVQGASAALAVLAPLTILTMVVPNFTVRTPGPTFGTSQLIFAAIISLVLYGSFVFVQTLRHRDYFLPLEGGMRRMLRRLLLALP